MFRYITRGCFRFLPQMGVSPSRMQRMGVYVLASITFLDTIKHVHPLAVQL